MMIPLTITTHAEHGVTELRIAGEIDPDTAGQITDAVHDALTAGARHICLDLAAVTFCDSSGIRTLLQAQHDAAARGVPLRLAAAHRNVVQVLEITGVLDLLRNGVVIPPPADV